MKKTSSADLFGGAAPQSTPAGEQQDLRTGVWPMFAIRNMHGHLANVSPYKSFVLDNLSIREDASACDVVEVDVVVKRVVPKAVAPKKRGKK
jgi:hypothetical protein